MAVKPVIDHGQIIERNSVLNRVANELVRNEGRLERIESGGTVTLAKT